jgi:hypothetical protein
LIYPPTEPALAQPVWLNAAKLDDIKFFKMGVDFIDNIDDDLLQTINET